MFMHASIGHIFFNMFALFMFACSRAGLYPKRFLNYYLACGLGAFFLHEMVVGYGYFTTYGTWFRGSRRCSIRQRAAGPSPADVRTGGGGVGCRFRTAARIRHVVPQHPASAAVSAGSHQGALFRPGLRSLELLLALDNNPGDNVAHSRTSVA